MKLKKPKFWDYKNKNFLSILLLPFTIPILVKKFFLNQKKFYTDKIKTICVGNIYLGGTGKTPISIKLDQILKDLNYKTTFIKKYYPNQIDEQKLLKINSTLFCSRNRIESLKDAVDKNFEIAIFDDGLQDSKIKYDITFVCFNISNWIGNGQLLPAGPLREKIISLKKYNAVFLNGNGENTEIIKSKILEVSNSIKIFETKYQILNSNELNRDRNYVIFSGIGNPSSFEKTLKNDNFKVIKSLHYPDHYNFSSKDILEIKKIAKSLDANILTTEKDFLRLEEYESKDIEYIKIELLVNEEEKLVKFLQNSL
jgi:tetraacyldisaccharide 4'-kinase